MPEPPLFAGFVSPRYTQTPNDLFDILLAPGYLTESELRVLLYIVRHTFGYAKDLDAISLTQFTDGIVRADGTRVDWGAGCRRDAAVKAVRNLERKGIITVTRHRDPRQGDMVNVYSLRWAPGESRGGGGSVEQTPRVRSTDSPGHLKGPPGDSSTDPQKIIQNTTEQEREEGPALAAVLAAYGGAWGTLQPLAAQVCATRGWTPAQLAAALTARPEIGLRAKLRALEKG